MTTDQEDTDSCLRMTLHEREEDGELMARPDFDWTDDERTAWSRFHDRAAIGDKIEVLAAIRDLLVAFPAMIPFFGIEGTRGEQLEQLAAAFEHCTEARACGFDVDWLPDNRGTIDVEEYVDANDAEAAMQAELDWLAEQDPEAAESIRRSMGWHGEPETLEAIGDDHGVSRECVRQWKNRGFGQMAINRSRVAADAGDLERAAELATQARDVARGSVRSQAEALLDVIDWGVNSAPVVCSPKTRKRRARGQLALDLE